MFAYRCCAPAPVAIVVAVAVSAVAAAAHVVLAIAARGVSSRSGMRMSDTDFAEYDSKVTFMFPGQGAQYMGMAAAVYEEVCMWVQQLHIDCLSANRRDMYQNTSIVPDHPTHSKR